jgi:Tfp pilus assembly protein FimT
MSPFRSVGGRLALALLVVVAGVLAIVYVIVVPLYSRSLENAELSTLSQELTAELPGYPSEPFSPYVDQWAVSMQERHTVRAVIYTYAAPPPTVTPYADSNLTSDDSDLVNDRVALQAMRRLAPARGIAVHGQKRYAEVAYPLSSAGPVVMFA